MKSTASAGTDACWSRCNTSEKCLPEACPANKWQVWVGSKWERQPAVIAIANEEEVKAYRAEQEQEAARVLEGIESVSIEGVTGVYAVSVNGVYIPTDALSDGNVTIYRNFAMVGNEFMWLEYFASTKQWQVKLSATVEGVYRCQASITVPTKCLPEECPAGKWEVYDGNKWEAQPIVTVTVISGEVVDACVEEVKKEAARVVKGTCSVHIEGQREIMLVK